MVSCGRGYNNGCSRGNGRQSFSYIRDHGVSSVACLPYMAGGGNPLLHFEAAPSVQDHCMHTATELTIFGISFERFFWYYLEKA